MKFLGHFGLWTFAYRNLLRNGRRSLATGLAVVFGYVGLVLLSAYILRVGLGMRASTVYLNQRGHIVVLKAGALDMFTSRPRRYLLSPLDQKKIEAALADRRDEIEFSGRYLGATGLLTGNGHSAPVTVSGVEPEIYARTAHHDEVMKWAPDWALPSDGIAAGAMKSDRRLISITSKVAARLGKKAPLALLAEPEREIQLVAKSYNGDLGVVDADLGPMHTTGMSFEDDTSTIATLSLVQDLLQTDGIEYIAIFLKPVASSYSRSRAIAHDLAAKLASGFEIHTYFDESWNPAYVGTMNFLFVMGTFFTILIAGAVALAIVNTTTLNLMERMREIGTLRAIGYSPRVMRGIFTREAALLALGCLVIGTLIALGIAAFVDDLHIRFRPPGTQGSIQFKLVVEPFICSIVAFLIFAITVGSTRYTIARKSRVKVIELLTDTGV